MVVAVLAFTYVSVCKLGHTNVHAWKWEGSGGRVEEGEGGGWDDGEALRTYSPKTVTSV